MSVALIVWVVAKVAIWRVAIGVILVFHCAVESEAVVTSSSWHIVYVLCKGSVVDWRIGIVASLVDSLSSLETSSCLACWLRCRMLTMQLVASLITYVRGSCMSLWRGFRQGLCNRIFWPPMKSWHQPWLHRKNGPLHRWNITFYCNIIFKIDLCMFLDLKKWSYLKCKFTNDKYTVK